MKLTVDITSDDVEEAVFQYLEAKLGITVSKDSMLVQVRSRQNYRDKEWEVGEIRILFT